MMQVNKKVEMLRLLYSRAVILASLQALIFSILFSSHTLSASPLKALGLWRNDKGTTIVRIERCKAGLCGRVYRTSFAIYDINNPNPSLRHRRLKGLIIFKTTRHLRNGTWEGEVYQFANGKKYSGTLQLLNDHALKVEGCVMYGYVCQSQKWTRVSG